MRFIPTRIHGVLDYLMGALLIAAPWLFDFAAGGAETWVPVALGAGVILYSLFTDYELGAVRRIAMPTHLSLDMLGGAFLAASPWLFGFDEIVYLPHLILGIAEIGAALMTERVPRTHAVQGTGHVHTSSRVQDTGFRTTDRPAAGSTTDTRTRTENERIRKDY